MNETRHIPAGARSRVRLLGTTDLHMHLTSHDYLADRPDPAVGLTRTASLIAQARAEATNENVLTLLFDNGDAMQGTPLGDLVTDQPGRTHPLMRAFGHLRYDAVGLGNHDFNFGLKALDSALLQAPCPVVSSNLRRLGNSKPPGFAPYAILDRIVRTAGREWPIRIGVLSFLPPQTALWDAHLLQGKAEVDDILESARHWLPDLKLACCDIIVALAHSGLDGGSAQPGMENAVIPLAALDGIDAVVAGHTHLLLPGAAYSNLAHVDAEAGTVHGKPVVMPGSSGSHLGVIDLELEGSGAGGWRVAGASSALRPIVGRCSSGTARPLVEEDRILAELLAEDHDDTQALMCQPVGHTAHALHSYFSFWAFDRALSTVAAAQAAALRRYLAGTGAENLPVLSAAAPCKFGARAGPGSYTDVPAGPLSQRHVADMHVFPNELRAVTVSGLQVLDWLERSASLFNQIAPSSCGSALVNTAMAGHDFDLLHGLQYQINVSAPARFWPDGSLRDTAARRIVDPCWNGKPLEPDQMFVVALNSYRASGGGNVAALSAARRVPLPRITIRDALRSYLSGGLPADPVAATTPTWSFAAMRGTSVKVQTGPGAQAHLGELSGRGVTVDGLDRDGFLQLTLPL